ncbi:hypothetical protein [Dysgonomonas sp. 25]|uniref:hypothetical protein n=1 Tax=Dysgonomonas sp. 25 TaxID=2302933 RepID=UPI0013D3279B|nr:hypothetical protein [Dysgonomonas sp. 25]NDV68267.1 hypothetical protein [Dysgonomonas sp. 25]
MSNKSIEGTYKKTYEGEYVKSYADQREKKKSYQQGVKSYKEITQKLSNYHKQEKGKQEDYEPVNTVMEVRPEGNVQTKRPSSSKGKIQREKPLIQTKTATTQTTTTASSIQGKKTEIKIEAKKKETTIEMPPPYIPNEAQQKQEKPKPQTKPQPKQQKAPTRNYDAYRGMVMNPIIPIGNGKYREMANKEIVDEAEARKILNYAGYTPKTSANMMMFYAVSIVLGIALKIAGPIGIAIWGYMTMVKATTVHKKTMGGLDLSIVMPATESERAIYRKRGKMEVNVALGIGALQAIYHFYVLGA